ncbi:MAG: putative photosynthetic complex assembly protein PuhE [Myxococcota bacterium]
MPETHAQLQLLALAASLLAWWAGTALVLSIVRREERRDGAFVVLGLVAAAALALTAVLAERTEPGAALLGFACGIVIWGWNEAAFLMGRIVGPQSTRHEAPEEDHGRLVHALRAFRAIAYHEGALVASGLALYALSASAPNRTAFYTFALLWGMRVSAKLNLHLGVRNLSDNWLPEELAHLRRYLRKRPLNALFPVSVFLATLLTLRLANDALAPDATGFAATRDTALASLAFLGLFEHWLLVLPVDPTWLWRRVAGGDAP